MKKLALLVMLAAGCAPDLGADAWLVDRVRLLAVRAEPAEASPGAATEYRAFLASPDGSEGAAQLSWSFCTAPKPLSENDTVARACVVDPDALVTLGTGLSLSTSVPQDACQRFGPDPPPQKAGDPPLRPRDADVTGGYYQPLRIDDGTGTSFALQRITCSLAGASAQVAADFRTRYHANTNPVLTEVIASVAGVAVSLDALPADSDVTLRVGWTAESAETYPVLDLTSRTLVDHRESLRVSWFVANGTLQLDHSGRDGNDLDAFAENTWHTPVGGPATLWIVVRDDRGGVAFQRIDGTAR